MPPDLQASVTPTRIRVAQVLAFVALVGSLVGALGPAERVRTSYAWPPRELPAAQPDGAWYTPLLLVRHRPQALSARIPCTLPPALPRAGRPVTVLASARRPEREDALSVTLEGARLAIAVGEEVLARVALPPDSARTEDCAYRLHLEGERWLLEGGAPEQRLEGPLAAPPVVFGLFTGLDLRRGERPQVEVLTHVHATRTLLRQALAWSVAALALLAALALVAFERRPGPGAALRRAWHGVRAHAHPVDAVVALVLLAWLFLAPAAFDDGWVMARESMFSSSRGFSAYYNALGTHHPLGYELEWVQHWLTQSTSALLVLRLPTLVCLAATWLLCRWILARVLARSAGTRGVALWSLASAFLLGALAWGMTVRPEPVTAVLVTGVLACVVLFVERGTVAPIALAALLVPLAITAHHSGIPAVAPLLAAAPSLARWARSQPAAASTIASSAVALFAILAFAGSDLEQRRADAQLTAEYGLGISWRTEFTRYTLLLEVSPVRRASVALILLAVLAFVLWRRRDGRDVSGLPLASLAIALAIFTATPSKNTAHFGALMGLAAVAVATETARLRASAPTARGWRATPFLVIGAVMVAVAWSWSPRRAWNALDLRTLDWTPSFESRLSVSALAIVLPLLLLALVALYKRRRDDHRASDAPWLVASWSAPLFALPLIAFTLLVFVADAVKTSGWTLARQNVETLRGDGGCGLADDLLVAVPSSARASRGYAEASRRPEWMPPPPIEGLARFPLAPAAEQGTSSPWFEPLGEPMGLFVSGTPRASELELEWGARQGDRIAPLGVDEVLVDGVLDLGTDVMPWRLLAAGELPVRPPGANVFRVTFRSEVAPGAALAVTAPVTYGRDELGRLSAASPTLVLPNVLTYFPCARLPKLRDGVVEAPGHVVLARHGSFVLENRESSTFSGIFDLYRLDRLPVADSRRVRETLEIYAVDRRISGAVQVAADNTTVIGP